ncbi:hypothetical protein ILUMI_00146 [Ignelater luminosus]|uniref:Uncharacterized protein n=1 Tax=Ignelater luminosus TaxID=2038154 RepID=A0A8K0DM68_IGNLU|nr:hypothetical protein ILUMI_00146 [Ignelater luminosus]
MSEELKQCLNSKGVITSRAKSDDLLDNEQIEKKNGGDDLEYNSDEDEIVTGNSTELPRQILDTEDVTKISEKTSQAEIHGEIEIEEQTAEEERQSIEDFIVTKKTDIKLKKEIREIQYCQNTTTNERSCSYCEPLKNKIKQANDELNVHRIRAKQFNLPMQETDADTTTFCCDLQQIQNLPRIPIQEAYYIRWRLHSIRLVLWI